MTNESALPSGWTLARVRELEPSAVLLDPASHVVVADQGSNPNYEVLHPTVVISFSGLCLCLCPEEGDGGALWWMGHLDESDGSIACWSPYAEADELEHAIRAL